MDYPKQIVSAMGIIRNSEGLILLILSPRRGWEPPGGIIEAGEDIIDGLQREILEEAGITAKIGRLIGLYSHITAPTKLMFTFAGTYAGGSLTSSPESLEAGWFTTETALKLVNHPSLRQRLQDALTIDGVIYRVYRHPPFELLKTVSLLPSSGDP